ncbi:acetyl-CoA carboxylase, carboxyltransferase subunit beta [Tepidibacter sp. Z1-5]|uniref:acetyl-CoA carboxylase, carboxyltransferase subunit beta n=1 Tax=Tepidibacter sp. Z1-5 TaxID=3134138 RepID=UPI0030C0E209
MIKKLLSKEKGYAQVSVNKKFKNKSVDEKFWIKCENCNSNIFIKEVEENLSLCPKCDRHFKLSARSRVDLLIDEKTFEELDEDLVSINILEFPEYEEKLERYTAKSREKDAVITGYGKLNGIDVVLCVMNSAFMMGSMGYIVGEKITRAIEYAIDNKLPVIIVCASGGARMQEGIISLMQMAKTSQALNKLSENGLPYISVLTDPTTGGITASFAMLGDVIMAEPNALIGFAGPRVIKQTIKQDLPAGFQKSEFLLEHGFLDLIVSRKNMKNKIQQILRMHGY